MARYRFLAYDITGTQFRAEIPFSSVKFGDVLNRPGSLDASLPARAAEAAQDILDPGRTTLWITNGNDLVWGGIVWAWRRDLSDAPEVRIAGQGLWSYYRDGRRTIRADATFTTTEQLSIVSSILATAHATANPLRLAVALKPSTSGITRTTSYLGRDRKPIGEAIEELAELDDGFDFNTRARWDTTTSPPIPSAALEVWYPQAGSVTDHVWEHGHDIVLEPVEVDASKLATTVDAIGGDTGSGTIIQTAVDSSGTYPYLEGTVSLTDETNTTTLGAAASGELARLQTPPRTTTAQILDPDRWPLGSWNLGDQVWISCRDTGVQIDGYWRITAWDCDVNPDGVDSITVTLAEGLPLGRPILPPALRLAQDDRDLARRVARLEHS